MAWCRQATSHYVSHCWPMLYHTASLGGNELTYSICQWLKLWYLRTLARDIPKSCFEPSIYCQYCKRYFIHCSCFIIIFTCIKVILISNHHSFLWFCITKLSCFFGEEPRLSDMTRYVSNRWSEGMLVLDNYVVLPECGCWKQNKMQENIINETWLIVTEPKWLPICRKHFPIIFSYM